jgi:hypothetical protein
MPRSSVAPELKPSRSNDCWLAHAKPSRSTCTTLGLHIPGRAKLRCLVGNAVSQETPNPDKLGEDLLPPTRRQQPPDLIQSNGNTHGSNRSREQTHQQPRQALPTQGARSIPQPGTGWCQQTAITRISCFPRGVEYSPAASTSNARISQNRVPLSRCQSQHLNDKRPRVQGLFLWS